MAVCKSITWRFVKNMGLRFCKSELESKKLHFQHSIWVILMHEVHELYFEKPRARNSYPLMGNLFWKCFPHHRHWHKDMLQLKKKKLCSFSNFVSNVSVEKIRRDQVIYEPMNTPDWVLVKSETVKSHIPFPCLGVNNEEISKHSNITGDVMWIVINTFYTLYI